MKVLDFYIEKGKTSQSFFFAGCLHWGSTQCDERQIRVDLRLAQSRGDRILLLGDNLDAILYNDPRYTEHLLKAEYKVDDAIDRLVKDFAKFLLPYASHIDVIGDGNHEYQLNKRYKTNLMARVVKEINLAGYNIKYGGYLYYAVYRFRSIKYSNYRRDLKILGIHGKGGGAEVSKGIIDVNRIRAYGFQYDILAFAHKHKDFATTDSYVIPHILVDNDNFVEVSHCKATQVGTYKKNYLIDGKGSKTDNSTWEEMKVFPVSCIGGKRAHVKLRKHRFLKSLGNGIGSERGRRWRWDIKIEV